jgi:hypothetical protein
LQQQAQVVVRAGQFPAVLGHLRMIGGELLVKGQGSTIRGLALAMPAQQIENAAQLEISSRLPPPLPLRGSSFLSVFVVVTHQGFQELYLLRRQFLAAAELVKHLVGSDQFNDLTSPLRGTLRLLPTVLRLRTSLFRFAAALLS